MCICSSWIRWIYINFGLNRCRCCIPIEIALHLNQWCPVRRHSIRFDRLDRLCLRCVPVFVYVRISRTTYHTGWHCDDWWCCFRLVYPRSECWHLCFVPIARNFANWLFEAPRLWLAILAQNFGCDQIEWNHCHRRCAVPLVSDCHQASSSHRFHCVQSEYISRLRCIGYWADFHNHRLEGRFGRNGQTVAIVQSVFAMTAIAKTVSSNWVCVQIGWYIVNSCRAPPIHLVLS